MENNKKHNKAKQNKEQNKTKNKKAKNIIDLQITIYPTKCQVLYESTLKRFKFDVNA